MSAGIETDKCELLRERAQCKGVQLIAYFALDRSEKHSALSELQFRQTPLQRLLLSAMVLNQERLLRRRARRLG